MGNLNPSYFKTQEPNKLDSKGFYKVKCIFKFYNKFKFKELHHKPVTGFAEKIF